MSRPTRIENLMKALGHPEEATGVDGVFARFFRLLSGDFIATNGMDATHVQQCLRELSKALSEDPSRHSSVQQEMSNLIAAWTNPSMPFPRVLQGLGAFGVEELELTIVAKRHDGMRVKRTLTIPTPTVVKNEMIDGTEFSIPISVYADGATEDEPLTESFIEDEYS